MELKLNRMKANELRVGNYYNNNGDRQIEPSDIDFCHRNNKAFCELNKPIPLTEEWLTEFGCIKIEPTRFAMPLQKGHSIHINFDNGLCYWAANMFFGVKVLYVHQLQNIYLALTGKELK